MPRKYEHWDEKTLTTGGVAHILRKVSGKILLAVGCIRDIGKEPLRLWKEYDGDGVILRGMMPAVSVEQDGYFTSEDYRKFLKMLEDIAVIFERIEAIHNVLVGMAKSVTEMRAELAEIEEHLTKLDGEVEEINATLDKIEARINDISKLIDEAETAINKLKEGADDCINDVKASGSGCLTLNASVSDQKATIIGSVSDATETEAGMMTQQDKLWLDELWSKYQNGEFGCDCEPITYQNPVVSLSYDKAKAEDESLKPSYSYYQTRTDNDGNETRITSGGDLVFAIADKGEGVSINEATGELTFPKNEDATEKTLGTVTLSVTMSGKTGTATDTAYQEGVEEPEPEPTPEPEPEVTYSTPSVKIEYPRVKAEGDTVSPTYSYSQQKYVDGVADGDPITNGGTLAFSTTDSNIEVDSSSGEATVPENTETETKTYGPVELRVTLNGKTGAGTCNIEQEAKEEEEPKPDYETSGEFTISANTGLVQNSGSGMVDEEEEVIVDGQDSSKIYVPSDKRLKITIEPEYVTRNEQLVPVYGSFYLGPIDRAGTNSVGDETQELANAGDMNTATWQLRLLYQQNGDGRSMNNNFVEFEMSDSGTGTTEYINGRSTYTHTFGETVVGYIGINLVRSGVVLNPGAETMVANGFTVKWEIVDA